MNPHQQELLILFAKAPRAGQVKTRMFPHLSPAQAAQLYRAMGQDLVRQLSGLRQVDFSIHYSPAHALEEMKLWLGEGLTFQPQKEGDLGQRLAYAFEQALQTHQRVIIIGCDLPTLDASVVRQAFHLLQQVDVVLGPTRDGGYYLIGLRHYQPELFRDIPWSSEQVLEKTLLRIQQLKLKVSLLPRERDLDTFQDVKHFWYRLREDKTLRMGDLAWATRQVVENLFVPSVMQNERS